LLGVTPEEAGWEVYRRAQRPEQPLVVTRKEAPVKEIIKTGEEVKLGDLPAPVHHELDPGHYLSAGFFTVYDPDTGLDNSALHRGWIKGPREIRVCLTEATHAAYIFRKYEKLNEAMPAAYWIGHHPLVELGCEYHAPNFQSHFATAGGLMGSPLRLVPSETLGEKFLVPADAEIVIEGFVMPKDYRPEGPFGEYPRYVGPQRWGPYMNVTAVTHRSDAVFQDIMVGHQHWMASLGLEGKVYETVKRAIPTVKNVYLPMSGCGIFHAYIQMEKQVEGSERLALMAALTADYRIKHAFVFDQDVDIFDEREVLLALATRFQGDQDLMIIPNMVGPVLDPSGNGIKSTKVGFDCTVPAGSRGFSKRLSIPSEVEKRVSLEQYLGKALQELRPERY